MALTVTFSVGTPCPAGNHVNITVTVGARSFVFPTSREEVIQDPEDGDLRNALLTIMRLCVGQLANKSGANIRNKLNALTIDLSLA